MSEDHKAAIRKALTGKKKSPEHRASISRTWVRGTRFLKTDNRRAMERAARAVEVADPHPKQARPRRGRTTWPRQRP